MNYKTSKYLKQVLVASLKKVTLLLGRFADASTLPVNVCSNFAPTHNVQKWSSLAEIRLNCSRNGVRGVGFEPTNPYGTGS